MIEELKGPVILDIPSDPASLFIVRALVWKLSERIGFDAKTGDILVLAIDEACTNVIRHGYKDCCDQRIVLTFTVQPDLLEITIRDFSEAVDPSTFKPRELDDIRPGGLGIHFIRSAVDEFQYNAVPGGGMLLRMIKLRPKQETL